MITTFQWGKSRSGKTVLISALASQFNLINEARNGYYLNIPNNAEKNLLLESYEGMKHGQFPPGTQPGEIREFNFEVWVQEDKKIKIPELDFTIFDYAGGDIISFNEEQQELQEKFDAASQKLFMVDGFNLLHDLGIRSDQIDFGAINLGISANSIYEIASFLGGITDNSPVAIIITKWDYVKKFISFDALLVKLYEKYPTIRRHAPAGSVILPVSAVGDDNTIDELVEDPITLGGERKIITNLKSIPKDNFNPSPENIDILLSFIFKRFIGSVVKDIDNGYDEWIKALNTSDTVQALENKIDHLSNSIHGSTIQRMWGHIRSIFSAGRTASSQLEILKYRLQQERNNLVLDQQQALDERNNDTQRLRYINFLSRMNETFDRFARLYPDACF